MVIRWLLYDVLSMPVMRNFSTPKNPKDFYCEIMRRKHDDHIASHSNVVNQFLHLISSTIFLYCYFIIFTQRALAMMLGVLSLALRQSGHAIFEPPCHDDEELLLGFNTRSKCFVFGTYALAPLFYKNPGDAWFNVTIFFVLGHTAIVCAQYNFCMSMVWFVKLATDPITDVITYWPSFFRVWTTPDWKKASIETFFGHWNKDTKKY